MRSLPGLWPELFGAEGKFGHAGQDQETAHEEFFVRVDGPNLTGNQIYCICCSRTRRRYKGTPDILLHPNFFTEVDNFGGQVGLVRAKSVKVLWIFKLVERSLSTFFCSQEIFSGAILSMWKRSIMIFFTKQWTYIPIYKRNHSLKFSYQPFHF